MNIGEDSFYKSFKTHHTHMSPVLVGSTPTTSKHDFIISQSHLGAHPRLTIPNQSHVTKKSIQYITSWKIKVAILINISTLVWRRGIQ